MASSSANVWAKRLWRCLLSIFAIHSLFLRSVSSANEGGALKSQISANEAKHFTLESALAGSSASAIFSPWTCAADTEMELLVRSPGTRLRILMFYPAGTSAEGVVRKFSHCREWVQPVAVPASPFADSFLYPSHYLANMQSLTQDCDFLITCPYHHAVIYRNSTLRPLTEQLIKQMLAEATTNNYDVIPLDPLPRVPLIGNLKHATGLAGLRAWHTLVVSLGLSNRETKILHHVHIVWKHSFLIRADAFRMLASLMTIAYNLVHMDSAVQARFPELSSEASLKLSEIGPTSSRKGNDPLLPSIFERLPSAFFALLNLSVPGLATKSFQFPPSAIRLRNCYESDELRAAIHTRPHRTLVGLLSMNTKPASAFKDVVFDGAVQQLSYCRDWVAPLQVEASRYLELGAFRSVFPDRLQTWIETTDLLIFPSVLTANTLLANNSYLFMQFFRRAFEALDGEHSSTQSIEVIPIYSASHAAMTLHASLHSFMSGKDKTKCFQSWNRILRRFQFTSAEIRHTVAHTLFFTEFAVRPQALGRLTRWMQRAMLWLEGDEELQSKKDCVYPILLHLLPFLSSLAGFLPPNATSTQFQLPLPSHSSALAMPPAPAGAMAPSRLQGPSASSLFSMRTHPPRGSLLRNWNEALCWPIPEIEAFVGALGSRTALLIFYSPDRHSSSLIRLAQNYASCRGWVHLVEVPVLTASTNTSQGGGNDRRTQGPPSGSMTPNFVHILESALPALIGKMVDLVAGLWIDALFGEEAPWRSEDLLSPLRQMTREDLDFLPLHGPPPRPKHAISLGPLSFSASSTSSSSSSLKSAPLAEVGSSLRQLNCSAEEIAWCQSLPHIPEMEAFVGRVSALLPLSKLLKEALYPFITGAASIPTTATLAQLPICLLALLKMKIGPLSQWKQPLSNRPRDISTRFRDSELYYCYQDKQVEQTVQLHRVAALIGYDRDTQEIGRISTCWPWIHPISLGSSILAIEDIFSMKAWSEVQSSNWIIVFSAQQLLNSAQENNDMEQEVSHPMIMEWTQEAIRNNKTVLAKGSAQEIEDPSLVWREARRKFLAEVLKTPVQHNGQDDEVFSVRQSLWILHNQRFHHIAKAMDAARTYFSTVLDDSQQRSLALQSLSYYLLTIDRSESNGTV